MDEDYFARGYNDLFMEDMSVINHLTQERVYLFECRDCGALVKEPAKHIEWHTRKPE